ncbi:MAG: hypothetical protein K940chlam3_01754 [Chlamydiae bacterium]|nr:hypothetical protein [Chlamydiota bacterium]
MISPITSEPALKKRKTNEDYKFCPIIEGKLYLGSKHAAEDRDLLLEHRITHILNVTNTIPCHFEEDFTYKKIPVSNRELEIVKRFEEAIQFIEEGERVFVHCRRGVNRSASMVIAYLIRSRSFSYQEAHDFVQARKANIHPHRVFQEKLIGFS